MIWVWVWIGVWLACLVFALSLSKIAGVNEASGDTDLADFGGSDNPLPGIAWRNYQRNKDNVESDNQAGCYW